MHSANYNSGNCPLIHNTSYFRLKKAKINGQQFLVAIRFSVGIQQNVISGSTNLFILFLVKAAGKLIGRSTIS